MAEDFEHYALMLLLCTPSGLHNKWASQTPADDKLRAELVELGFSDAKIVQYMQDMSIKGGLYIHRPLFKAVAETIQQVFPMYAGTGPHPPGGSAKAIVNALKNISGSK